VNKLAGIVILAFGVFLVTKSLKDFFEEKESGYLTIKLFGAGALAIFVGFVLLFEKYELF
jgi:hypothetical protein